MTRTAAGPPRRGRPPAARASGPAWIAAATMTAAILLAPPASNHFWGVNGLRSLPPAAAAGVALAAIVASRLAGLVHRGAALRWTVAIAAAWAIAFPLREKIHFLGDTQLRVRTLGMAGADWIPLFASWWSRLHANPLDIGVNVLGVHALQNLGLTVIQAVSAVSWLLAVAYLAGCWRLAGQAAGDGAPRWGLAAAVAMSGVLQAFAGYAESAGLVAAAAVWWWAEMLAPLRDRRQAWRTIAAFVALALAHRVGIVAAAALIARAAGPAIEGDRPAVRRLLRHASYGAIAAVAAGMLATGAGAQLATDARDLFAAARAAGPRAGDLLNSLVLVAPLAWLAPFAAGRAALRAWAASPVTLWLALAAAPLLVVLGGIYPAAAHHLGAQREWEANVLTGITLTVAGATLLGRLDVAARRAALAVLLPVLTLVAGGWLAANADATVATRRANLQAERPSALTPSQLGYLHAFLGQRAMDEGRFATGARHFDAAFAAGGNPRRALLACEAWLAAGRPDAARAALDRAGVPATLPAELAAIAQRLAGMISAATDTATARAPAGR